MLIALDKCQLCGSTDFIGLNGIIVKPDRRKAQLNLREEDTAWYMCQKCSFIFQNPRLSREYIEDYYARSAYHMENQEIGQGQIGHTLRQLARMELYLGINGINIGATRGAICLDYGCGIGGALNFLAERGNEIWGVELDRREIEFGKKNYKVNFVTAPEEIPADKRFDFIFTHHALEHVFDPNDFFSYASKTLKPGGVLMVTVPSWRYSNTMNMINGFDISDNSMYDHVSLAGFMNKYGLYQFSHMYQNADDWELVALARKSNSKNYYGFDYKETLAELYTNVAKRHAERLGEQGVMVRNPIIVKM